MSQPPLFHKRIVDVLAVMGGAVTAPRWIRADDGLSYIVKDEAAGLTTVRAAEFIWLSVAHAIGLPAPKAEVIEDSLARKLLVGTRREQSAIGKDQATCIAALLSGKVHEGGRQLSRIFAFDLFAENADRHPGNYLILDDGGAMALFAIDYSHVGVRPGLGGVDPMSALCNTPLFFPHVVAPYGTDIPAALDVIDRLDQLPVPEVQAFLTVMPAEWMTPLDKAAVLDWWQGDDRHVRAGAIKQGLQNGAYF